MSEQVDETGIGHDEAEPPPARVRPVDRRFWALIGLGVGAATVAVAVATSVVPAGSSEPARTATATSTAAPPAATTAVAPATEQPPTSTVPAAEDAQAGQELAGVAAGLTDPVVLTSPAEWDRWAGARPTYPGDRDIDGCPVMAERLGGALGMRFSYWFGTLPQGPYGCYYAPVPCTTTAARTPTSRAWAGWPTEPAR